MKIKRGSVTPVDLTGQADGDYIRNDGGVWKPKNSYESLRGLIDENVYHNYPPTQWLTRAVTSGTGVTSLSVPRLVTTRTGTTAGSKAIRTSDYNHALNYIGDLRYYNITFTRKIIIRVLYATVNIADGQAWFMFGPDRDFGAEDPTSSCIGFRLDGLALKGIVHNGTSLEVVDLTTNVIDNERTNSMLIVSDGSGNVSWYPQETLKGSSASGPVTDGVTGALSASVTNLATTTNVWFLVNGIAMLGEK